MKLNELPAGSSAVIVSIMDDELSRQLGELGLVTGQRVSIEVIAPMGCPIMLSCEEMKLSLRKRDAGQIIVGN